MPKYFLYKNTVKEYIHCTYEQIFGFTWRFISTHKHKAERKIMILLITSTSLGVSLLRDNKIYFFFFDWFKTESFFLTYVLKNKGSN